MLLELHLIILTLHNGIVIVKILNKLGSTTLNAFTGFNELLNSVNLGPNSQVIPMSTKCCATGTCDNGGGNW